MDFINHVTLLAAGGVALAVQFLKLNFVPVGFANRHPVPTNIVASVVAALLAVWVGPLNPVSWTDWLGVVGTIAVVAALVYNQLLGRWAALKAAEGPGRPVVASNATVVK